MVSQWKRCCTVLAVCLSVGLAACGPPEEDPDTGVDTGDTGVAPDGDVDEGDTMADGGGDTTGGPECMVDDDCSGSQVCEQEECVAPSCSSNDDCSEPTPVCNEEADTCVECMQNADCSQGETCTDNNTCKAQGAQCAAVGDACDPEGGPAGSGFQCVGIATSDQSGQCLKTCDPQASSNPCSSGQACLPASNSQDANFVCYTSQCTGPDDLDSCDNIESHPLFTETSSFKCVSLSNDADLCMPDGSKAAGETCTAASPVTGLFCEEGQTCEACQKGNACIGGTCRQICRANAGDDRYKCGGDNASCVGANASNIVTGGAGFCGEQCDAYSRGQCSQDGEGCYPLNNDVGYCRSAGSKGFMDECQPATGDNPAKNECKEGMQCITFQQNPEQISRCMPICDAPAPDEGNRNDNDATCGGKMYGRFAHLASDPSAIDVYLNGNRKVNDLSTGSTSDADGSTDGSQFFAFNPSEQNVQIVDGSASDASSPIVESKPFVKSGQVRTWAVTVDANADPVLKSVPVPVGVSAPASGKAKVRAVHQVPDVTGGGGNAVSVDVVAVPQSGSLGSDGLELLAGGSAGATGSFAEVAADTYDLYLFEQGASRDDGNELAKLTGITIEADTTSSIYLTGTAASGDNAELTATMVPYTSAPKQPEYTCWNRGQQDPGPASGLCLQGCDVPGDYGKDSCFKDGNSCAPLGQGGSHFCVPGGDKAVGDSCNPSGFMTCEEGAFCREYGDGSGTCHSNCIGGSNDSNSTLTCADSRSCTADDGNFGRCNPECSPSDSYGDQNCPENLRSCFPESVDMQGNAQGAFCSPSHDKEEGNTCGGNPDNRQVTLQNCKAGMYCAYDQATSDQPFIGQFVHRSDTEPTCKKPCDPFADDPNCPDGQACGVDLAFNASSEVGVCMDQAEGLNSKSTTTRCTQANVGKVCGDHSHCVSAQGQHICYEFCNWSDKSGCTDPTHECQPFSNGPIGGLGICAPPQ